MDDGGLTMHPVVRKVLKRIYPYFSPSMQVRLQALYVMVFQRQITSKHPTSSSALRPQATVCLEEAYAHICAHCGEIHFDVVFFAPWLTRGGADKEILQYLRYYAERGYRVLLILTEIADSPWLDRVPAGVTVVEAKAFLSGLSPDDCDLVLTRLLLQTCPCAYSRGEFGAWLEDLVQPLPCPENQWQPACGQPVLRRLR